MANPRDTLITMAVKIVLNSAQDHYQKTESILPWDEYWKHHLKITPFKTFDNHVQMLANRCVDRGLTIVDDIADDIIESLAI